MRKLHIFLLLQLLCLVRADLFTGNEALFVSKMQEVFMIKDGSSIVDPKDSIIISALRKELQSILADYSTLSNFTDFRNPSIIGDDKLVTLLMLGIMGNFHRKSVTNADVYDDVQIVFDPATGSFITLQNLRDTEITVFKALLVTSVGGLLLIFMMEKSGKVAPADKKENAALHLNSIVHDSTLGLYNYPIRLRK